MLVVEVVVPFDVVLDGVVVVVVFDCVVVETEVVVVLLVVEFVDDVV